MRVCNDYYNFRTDNQMYTALVIWNDFVVSVIFWADAYALSSMNVLL